MSSILPQHFDEIPYYASDLIAPNNNQIDWDFDRLGDFQNSASSPTRFFVQPREQAHQPRNLFRDFMPNPPTNEQDLAEEELQRQVYERFIGSSAVQASRNNAREILELAAQLREIREIRETARAIREAGRANREQVLSSDNVLRVFGIVKIINKLPLKVELNADESQCECPLCFESKQTNVFIEFKCKHSFCGDCTKTYLQKCFSEGKDPVCHLCRAEVGEITVHTEEIKNNLSAFVQM